MVAPAPVGRRTSTPADRVAGSGGLRQGVEAPAGGQGSPAGDRWRRIPRTLHPVAWWLWALGLAVAADRTTNPLLLALILATAGWVVARRRVDAPWARAFRWYLGMALAVVAIRVVFRLVFGGGTFGGDHVLFSLPRVPLPAWAAGVRLGGPVSLEATVAACVNGLQLGTLICCIGAANALANPKRVLRALPGALRELGVAVVVAVTVAPQLVDSAGRVRRARRLRAGDTGRWRLVRSIVVPVLEDAFERSLLLAAAMDGRGFGRRPPVAPGRRRAATGLLLGGLAVLCAGLYGLLDPGAPAAAGLPVVAAGAAACCAGLAAGSGGGGQTRYRPDRWRPAELAVVACGIVPAAATIIGRAAPAGALSMPVAPLAWPALPALPVLAVVIAGLAGVLAPPPPASGRRVRA